MTSKIVEKYVSGEKAQMRKKPCKPTFLGQPFIIFQVTMFPSEVIEVEEHPLIGWCAYLAVCFCRILMTFTGSATYRDQ
jgi:hypothetical protein